MPIGETLAGARQRAGLTVAQVSEQTRIREAVIEAIEGGDYAACGGDFYARADIRSIARAVGADSGPLIAEYDALHRARGSLSAVSLEELLAASVPAPRRPRAGSQAAPGPGGPAYRPRGRWLSRVVVLGLALVLGFGVYSRLAGSRHGAAAPPAGGAHAVTHQPAGPGGPGPAPKLTHAAVTPAPARKVTHAPGTPAPAPTAAHAAPAPAPAPAPAAAAAATPAGAGAAGPGGGSPAPAQRAAGGSRATSPAHSLADHRPPSEPVLRPRSAHRRASSGHGHRRRHHHRRHAQAAQEAAGQYGR